MHLRHMSTPPLLETTTAMCFAFLFFSQEGATLGFPEMPEGAITIG